MRERGGEPIGNGLGGSSRESPLQDRVRRSCVVCCLRGSGFGVGACRVAGHRMPGVASFISDVASSEGSMFSTENSTLEESIEVSDSIDSAIWHSSSIANTLPSSSTLSSQWETYSPIAREVRCRAVTYQQARSLDCLFKAFVLLSGKVRYFPIVRANAIFG